MKKLILMAALAFASLAHAEPLNNQVGQCPTDVAGNATGSCTNQSQIQGDTTSSVKGPTNAPSSSVQQGVSAASVAAGNEFSPNFDNKAQVTQNSTNTTTGTINHVITSTGGSTTGNVSNVNGTTGPSSAQSGAVTGTTTSAGGTGGGASAGGGASDQRQQQSIKDSGNSSASAQGAAGNSAVQIDASDRSQSSYTSRTTVLPPVLHGPGVTSITSGDMIKEVGECGPDVIIISHKVYGVHRGAMGGESPIDQGYDQEIVDAPVPFKIINGQAYGAQVTIITTKIGISTASSISIGGYGKDGQGAQGGGARSGGAERIFQRITKRTCLLPVAAHLPTRQDRN